MPCMKVFDAYRRFERYAQDDVTRSEARLRKFLIVYAAALVAMLVPDGVWLAWAGSHLYRPALGDLLAESFQPVPAILFYLVYVVGLTVLSRSQTKAGAAGRGALFGFCAYATYDLTNEATLRHWPAYLTAADLAWGTVLSAFAALVAALVRRRLA